MASPRYVESQVVYLNVNMSSGVDGPSDVYSLVARNTPVLENPSDWAVAVIRATLPCTSVWMWQPTLLTTSTGVDPALCDGYNCIYAVTLRFNSFSSGAVFLRAIPSNQAAAPAAPVAAQPTNGWAAVYDFDTIAQMFNAAVATAYANLLAQVPSLNPNPPYYVYNAATQLWTLNCFPMSQYDQSAGLADRVLLYYNSETEPYLRAWRYQTIARPTGFDSGQDDLIVLRNDFSNWFELSSGAWVPPPASDGSGYPSDPTAARLAVSTMWPAPDVFNALNTIVLTTSIPIQSEYAALPNSQVGLAAQNQTIAMLADFAVAAGDGQFNSPLEYVASSIIPGARFVNCTGTAPLQSFEIRALWSDSAGNLYPLQTIGQNQVASVKLAFYKKAALFGR